MRKLKIIVVAVALCVIGGSIIQQQLFKKPPETVHVFFEVYATNPALLQMVEYVKLPAADKKIIAWHRFTDRKNKVDLEALNTIEFPLSPKEGRWYAGAAAMAELIDAYAQQHPEVNFVFYGNMNHTEVTLLPLLAKIPVNRVKHIHLYEDGNGSFYREDFFRKMPDIPIEKAWEAYQESGVAENLFYPIFNVSLHLKYNTTYHVGLLEKIKKLPEKADILNHIKAENLQSVHFQEIGASLSAAEKDLFYRLIGFDESYWRQIMQNHKTIVFASGFLFEDSVKVQAQVDLLKRLVQGDMYPFLKKEQYVFLHKPHPSLSARKERESIKAAFPDMIEISAQLPFEVFIIAGLLPDYVAGYSSSIFFSIPSERVLFYIRRAQRDGYTNTIKRLKLFPSKKMIFLQEKH